MLPARVARPAARAPLACSCTRPAHLPRPAASRPTTPRAGLATRTTRPRTTPQASGGLLKGQEGRDGARQQWRQPVRARHLATEAPTQSPSGPTAAYDREVASGAIQNDEHQRSIVAILQDMYDQLEAYTPPPIGPLPLPIQPSFWDRLMRSRLFADMADELHQANTAVIPLPPPPPGLPKGLYLFGSVGCGKSFLMDLFYANLPPKYRGTGDGKSKFGSRRVHFHQFMMDVHKKGHRIKMEHGVSQDWVVMAAREIAEETRVLCFDEFQVTDIADAMILRRLMEALHAHGVVCVMTSNRAPDDLYKNGIQREQFLPCIELIKNSFTVHCLDSEIDYRKRPRELSRVYFHPINGENLAEFDKLFESTCHAIDPGDAVVADRLLSVWGRPVPIPLSTSHVAQFGFYDLCGAPHSAADYLEITKTFGTIFLKDVPQLGLETKDQARRFILFVDAAYEARTKLFVLSDPPIASVFSDERRATGEITPHMRAMMDDLGLSADVVGASSIFTGDEEVFAFARAVSRITEMGSVQWARQHAVNLHGQGLKEEQVRNEGEQVATA
ncbi:ATPase [Rhodotorula toruloides]|uniref:AFG1-like ATPase-domain containing protein n=1 Tax=Rhodotorula toruloides TaxID=5286 RepID=A0A0K3CDP4_RHOTO|nr:AFG1-like ATPase-domain containing protein [Rhodotorula toruloides]